MLTYPCTNILQTTTADLQNLQENQSSISMYDQQSMDLQPQPNDYYDGEAMYGGEPVVAV